MGGGGSEARNQHSGTRRTFDHTHGESYMTTNRIQPRLLAVTLTAIATTAGEASGQSRVELEGVPSARVVTEDGGATRREVLTTEQQQEFIVRIVERDGRYFWVSREMTEMARAESGSFITYHALNGSGYVKVLALHVRRLVDQLPQSERRQQVRYIEHLSLGFGTFTYIGYFQ